MLPESLPRAIAASSKTPNQTPHTTKNLFGLHASRVKNGLFSVKEVGLTPPSQPSQFRMPICCGIKNNCVPCGRATYDIDRREQDIHPLIQGLPTMCGTHRNAYLRHVQDAGPPRPDGCLFYQNGRGWCQHDAEPGRHQCAEHRMRGEQARQREQARQAAPVEAAPARPVRWNLAAIAINNQSVHTAPVYKQMNEGLKKLHAIKVPDKFSSMFTATRAWMTHIPQELKAFTDYLKVINDVEVWRGKEVRYRLAFRALCYKIHTEPDKERQTEMWRRLFQECLEAVGMCCDGHLSRLANALVGFDDDFKPAIPLGELIQQKLAAISEMEDADKIRLATEFFDEHAVPDAERAPWLEALA